MRNKQEQAGYDFARGAVSYMAELVAIMLAIVITVLVLRLVLGLGVDDSDRDSWHRSGLVVHTDAKTGVQYLSDGHGGLVRRSDK